MALQVTNSLLFQPDKTKVLSQMKGPVCVGSHLNTCTVIPVFLACHTFPELWGKLAASPTAQGSHSSACASRELERVKGNNVLRNGLFAAWADIFLVSLVTCRHTPGPRVKLQPGSLAQGQDLADDKRGRPSFGKSHHLKKQENIKEY